MIKWSVLFILFLGSLCYGDTPPNIKDSANPAQNLFLEGVSLYQNHKYEESFQKFSESLKSEPLNKFTLYNMSLSANKTNRPGFALGGLRRALYIDPYFSSAREFLNFLQNRISAAALNDLGAWEDYRGLVLAYVSMDITLGLTLFFLLYSGTLLLRYFGQRKKALFNDLTLPKAPLAGFIALGLFILCLLIFTTKIIDFYQPRATLISETEDLKSGPSLDFNSLLKVTQGQELIIQNVNGEWAQVTNPGGISGWVPKASLFYTSGRLPW